MSDEITVPGTEDSPEASAGPSVRGFQLTIMDDGRIWKSAGRGCSIGSHHANDLVIDDATVSRFHCEIAIDGEGARVRDQGSRNGTVVDGVRVETGWLKSGSLLRLGRAAVRFDLRADRHSLRLSSENRFGTLVGESVAMRSTFALLERAGGSDATVLLEGETGTGKGAAAEAIHQASARRERPFVVVDTSVIPATLLEAELFGFEKGSFTGADARRIGAFEEADGGTIFLDEIGELPADLQPKLLRVIESREIRRLGQNAMRPIDVRLIAATNRDLRVEVNAARFRADLYFRLAVLKIPMPALRQHPEDIPVLARKILGDLGVDADAFLTRELLAALAHGAWPGNVRELRNHLERCVILEDDVPLGEDPPLEPGETLDYAEARRAALASFERDYVSNLLAAHDGKVPAAARAGGLARVYLYRLMRRHGFRR